MPAPVGDEVGEFVPALINGVEGSYLVTLFAVPAASAAAQLVSSAGGTLGQVYEHALNGFSAHLTEEQAETLSFHPWVKRVAQDFYIQEDAASGDPVLQFCYDATMETVNTRPLPPLPGGGNPVRQQDLDCADPTPEFGCIDGWGIDRVDRVSGNARDESYSYRQDGTTVTVYVIDRGVAGSHREFIGPSGTRVATGVDTFCSQPPCGFGNIPCAGSSIGNGHGTHVAGILGGRTFGIAKDVQIYPLRSLCVNYSQLAYINALEWILAEQEVSDPVAIVNISGMNGCWASPNQPPPPDCNNGANLREAVINTAARNNLLVVQSAGNQSFAGGGGLADACLRSFGDEDAYTGANRDAIARVVVVAGSDEGEGSDPVVNEGLWRDDVNQAGSNAGRCVDIFAPASHIGMRPALRGNWSDGVTLLSTGS